MKPSSTIPAAIVLAGIILASAVYVLMSEREPSTASKTGNPALVRPVGANDHILGSPTAPVVIVEYSDFDCTYCKQFHEALHKAVADLGADGQVAWVFRQFPITQLHPNAYKHAVASECVAQTAGNDAFWKFADALFAGQPTDPNQYGALAQTAGATGTAFATCYANASTTVATRIDADIQNGKDAGANGTPYSIIIAGGKTTVLPGAYPYAELKDALQTALARVR